jgi:hypothetical protein
VRHSCGERKPMIACFSGYITLLFNSSKRNTRIERLWVEIGTQFARRWRAFFTRLGRMHGLDRKDPAHLWLLHALFLDGINEDCAAFQNEWNSKPVRGSKTNNRSPLVSVDKCQCSRVQCVNILHTLLVRT